MNEEELAAWIDLIKVKLDLDHIRLDKHASCGKFRAPEEFNIRHLDSRIWCDGMCDY